jgi:hypothetical protein
LIVLAAVAILLLLYFVQIDVFFAGGPPSQPAGIEQHPWVLEELLAKDAKQIRRPRTPKLLLSEPYQFVAPVTREDADRGTVTIHLDTAGRIQAAWECTYEQANITYRIDAQMNGNIDVKRTYRDDEGKDKSRLFFIARGTYTKTPLTGSVAGGETGTSWLTGWIRPDQSFVGHVTITKNREWAAAYAFSSP